MAWALRGENTLTRSAVFAAAFAVLVGCSASDSDAEETHVAKKVKVSQSQSVGQGNFGAYLAAHSARNREDIKGAADNYLAALKDDPKNVSILGLALIYTTADGRFDVAERIAETLSHVKVDSTLAGYVQIVNAVHDQKWDKAASFLGKQKTNSINGLLLPLAGAWIALGQGDADKAVDALKPLSQKTAFLPVYNFHLALIYDVAGRNAEAEAAYNATLKGGAVRSIHAIQAAGRFFNRVGKPERTAELLTQYTKVNGDGPIVQAMRKQLLVEQLSTPIVPNPAAGLGEAFFSVATSLSNAQIWELSLSLSQLSLRLHPKLDLARVLVGDVFENHGDYERANQTYRLIDKTSPISYSVQLRIAKNMESIDQIDGAAKALEGLARTYEDRPGPLIELGDLYREHKSYKKAVDAYSKALARVPKLTNDYWVLLYTRGVSYERLKRWKEAEADFQKALELSPDQPLVLNYLGYSWLERGERMGEAISMIEKAVRARPNDGYVVDSLGWAHYLRGNFKDAVKELEQAIILVSDDATINEHLGDAYWRIGREREARFQWKRSLTFDKDGDNVDAIRKKLEHGLPPISSPKTTK